MWKESRAVTPECKGMIWREAAVAHPKKQSQQPQGQTTVRITGRDVSEVTTFN